MPPPSRADALVRIQEARAAGRRHGATLLLSAEAEPRMRWRMPPDVAVSAQESLDLALAGDRLGEAVLDLIGTDRARAVDLSFELPAISSRVHLRLFDCVYEEPLDDAEAVLLLERLARMPQALLPRVAPGGHEWTAKTDVGGRKHVFGISGGSLEDACEAALRMGIALTFIETGRLPDRGAAGARVDDLHPNHLSGIQEAARQRLDAALAETDQ